MMTQYHSPHLRQFARVVFAILLVVGIAVPSAEAFGFRDARTIKSTPERQDGARSTQIPELSDDEIAFAVRDALQSWNTPAFDQTVEDSLRRGRRLLSTLATDVPANANLRVLSVRNITRLDRYEIEHGGEGVVGVTVVEATVRTTLEFLSDSGQFTQRDGVNTLVLEILHAP